MREKQQQPDAQSVALNDKHQKLSGLFATKKRHMGIEKALKGGAHGLS